MPSQPIEKKPRRTMKPGGGKAKGSGFESKVAKILSAGLAPLNFIRTPGSGARVGGKNFETIGQLLGEEALAIFVGDVVPVNEKQVSRRFQWSIECKFYKTPDTLPHLMSGNANIFKWFQEAMVDAAKVDRYPMLIFKWNNTKIFVAVDSPPIDAPPPTIRLTSYHAPDVMGLDIYELDALLTPEAIASGFWTREVV